MKASWLAVAAVIAACNPDRGPKWRPTGSTAPRDGGTLRIALKDSIKSLDPLIGGNDEISAVPAHMVFDTLVDFERDGLGLVPRLASAWEISPDGLVYTFHLRPGITYADARPIVAADFKYALERALVTPDAQGRGDLADVVGNAAVTRDAPGCVGITTPDDRTLVIELARRNAAFIYVMTMIFTTPERRDYVVAAGDDIRRRPLATGPYRVESWDEGQRLVLVKNAHYHASDRGHLERIEIAEDIARDTQFLMFERGDLDTAERLTAPDLLWITSEPAWEKYIHRRTLMNAYGSRMNVRVKPFDDVRVRRALNYAVDKDHTTKLLAGTSVPSHGILAPGMLGRDDTIPPYPHDVDKAKALLAEAGYDKGLDLDYLTITDDEARKIAQSLQSDLADAGVRLHLTTVSLDAWGSIIGQPTGASFSLAGWTADFPDPINFLDAQFSSRQIAETDSVNNTFYANAALDTILEAARVELDPAARAVLYRRAERIVYDDAPWLWNYHQGMVEITQPYVQGYEPHPVWGRDYTGTWLDLGSDGEPVPK